MQQLLFVIELLYNEVFPNALHTLHATGVTVGDESCCITKPAACISEGFVVQQLNFVSSDTTRHEMRSALKKVMKFGFKLGFDARSDNTVHAAEQFAKVKLTSLHSCPLHSYPLHSCPDDWGVLQLHPDFLHQITCKRENLMKMNFFDLLDISKLERRIFGHGAISSSFRLVWLQGDTVLPE